MRRIKLQFTDWALVHIVYQRCLNILSVTGGSYEVWTLQISCHIRVRHVLDTDTPQTLSDTCRTCYLACLLFIIFCFIGHNQDTPVLPPDMCPRPCPCFVGASKLKYVAIREVPNMSCYSFLCINKLF